MVSLGLFPTRIQVHPSLSAEMNINLFIKNEFESDVYGSGNKVRKLQYLLPHLSDTGYTDVILDGTTFSNSCMAVAHYSGMFGLGCHLIIYGEPTLTGNNLQMVLSGAEIHYLPEWNPEEIERLNQKISNTIGQKGGRSYSIPTGVTNALTALGAYDMSIEIAAQQTLFNKQFDFIVLPVGTGGTVAGLQLGKLALGERWKIIGIAIANDERYFQEVYTTIAEEIIQIDNRFSGIESGRLEVFEGALGSGYAMYTSQDVDDMLTMRRLHQVIFDLTYSWKGFKGLIQLVKEKHIPHGSNVLFIHTGGLNERFAPPYDVCQLRESTKTRNPR